MLKKLIIINGPAGVGKTTISRELHKRLEGSVWLDGDWCWMMNPVVANAENCKMVEDNITYLLGNFLNNSSIQFIIFDWVIHKEEIFEQILEKLEDRKFELYKITLLCSEEELKLRMMKDGREAKQIEASLQNLRSYRQMATCKIDTTRAQVQEVVNSVLTITGLNKTGW